MFSQHVQAKFLLNIVLLILISKSIALHWTYAFPLYKVAKRFNLPTIGSLQLRIFLLNAGPDTLYNIIAV